SMANTRAVTPSRTGTRPMSRPVMNLSISPLGWVWSPARAPRAGQGSRLEVEGWGGRQASYVEDLLLVQALPVQQGLGERVELRAVLGQQPQRLLVALVDDLLDLRVD